MIYDNIGEYTIAYYKLYFDIPEYNFWALEAWFPTLSCGFRCQRQSYRHLRLGERALVLLGLAPSTVGVGIIRNTGSGPYKILL